MGFDPTTYALSKSAAETQTNRLSLQEENLQAKLDNLASVLYSREYPLYASTYGNGVIYVRDAAAKTIGYIQVDSELAGQTLYVQISNASGMTEAQAEVNDKGYATVNLSTASGENFFYLTTQAYAFPPTGDGGHGELDGVYVNARTNENGLAVYDSIRLTNGVHAVVCYRLDYELYSAIVNETPEKEGVTASGKVVTFVPLDTLSPGEFGNDFLYMKLDGYPYGTQENPTYVQTGYPNPDCQVYYVKRFSDPE